MMDGASSSPSTTEPATDAAAQTATATHSVDESNTAATAPPASEVVATGENDGVEPSTEPAVATASAPPGNNAIAPAAVQEDESAPAPSASAEVSAKSERSDTDESAAQPLNEPVPPAADPATAAAATPASVTGEKRKETESANGADTSTEGSNVSKKQKTAEPALSASIAAIKEEHVNSAAATPTSPVAAAPAAPFVVDTKAASTAAANVVANTTDGTPIMLSRDDMAKMEEDDGLVKFDVISNDGTPEHMVQLTTLKNIFAKQLPKMPKEYIVRLVFDRNHRSMVILKNGTRVIGGICYRPFLPNGFAEIAFCAINAADQVKGYGTRLMNHLKEYVKHAGITHFLTYADNYAIGYFKKQGFAKVVSMPRPNWFGYIKDYDGGTLMECTIHYQINYLQITNMVHKQRKAIQDKIKERSRSHIVYPGLEKFAEGRLMDIYIIPGVKEAGWSQATIRNSRIGTRDPGSLKTQLTQLWKAVSSHRSAWPFHEPVDTTIVVDYLEYIKDPVDLSLIAKRIESGQYISKAALRADLDRMCDNCMVYNTPDTNYYKAAKDLLEFIDRRIPIRDGAGKKP